MVIEVNHTQEGGGLCYVTHRTTAGWIKWSCDLFFWMKCWEIRKLHVSKNIPDMKNIYIPQGEPVCGMDFEPWLKPCCHVCLEKLDPTIYL